MQKVFGRVFKCPQINMYLVFYLNISFWVFDPTLDVQIFNVETEVDMSPS